MNKIKDVAADTLGAAVVNQKKKSAKHLDDFVNGQRIVIKSYLDMINDRTETLKAANDD